MSHVFSYYRYFVNCIYARTVQNCSQPAADFVISYLLLTYRSYFYSQFGCDLGKIGKLLLMLTQ